MGQPTKKNGNHPRENLRPNAKLSFRHPSRKHFTARTWPAPGARPGGSTNQPTTSNRTTHRQKKTESPPGPNSLASSGPSPRRPKTGAKLILLYENFPKTLSSPVVTPHTSPLPSRPNPHFRTRNPPTPPPQKLNPQGLGFSTSPYFP